MSGGKQNMQQIDLDHPYDLQKKTQNLPCWLIASASQEHKGKEHSLPESLLCVLCSSLSLSHLIPGQHWKAGIIMPMLQSSWEASVASGI